MKCETCKHFSLRKMIRDPYYYAGDIPCIRCIHYRQQDDEYESVIEEEEFKADTGNNINWNSRN